MSKITVCILLYSDWHLLKVLLKSLVDQEIFINQIIISSDNPEAIELKEIIKIASDAQLKCSMNIRQNNINVGPVEHVKLLINQVNTEYVMFVGADDFFHVDYFQCISNLIDYGYSAITPMHYRVNLDGDIVGKSSSKSSSIIDGNHLKRILETERFPIPSPGTTYRILDLKKVIYIENIVNEDDQFLFSCILNNGWILVPRHLFFYRVSDSGLSSWHRKPFISNATLKKYLLIEFLNRKSQNICWISQINNSSLTNKSYFVEMCLRNINKYNIKIQQIDSHYLLFLHRIAALTKLVTLQIKSVFYKLKFSISKSS